MLWNNFASIIMAFIGHDAGLSRVYVSFGKFLVVARWNCGVDNSSTRECIHYIVLNELIEQGYSSTTQS